MRGGEWKEAGLADSLGKGGYAACYMGGFGLGQPMVVVVVVICTTIPLTLRPGRLTKKVSYILRNINCLLS